VTVPDQEEVNDSGTADEQPEYNELVPVASLRRHSRHGEANRWFTVVVTPNPILKEIHLVMSMFTVADSDPPFTASVSWADAAGFDVVEGTEWTDTANGSVVAIDAVDETATFTVVAPGSTVITATGTNADGTTATVVGAVTVTGGDAVVGVMTFVPGVAPTPVPTPTPTPVAAAISYDPISGLPLYTYDDPNGTPDATIWTQVTDVTASDGTALWTNSQDSPNSTSPIGDPGGAFTVYAGTPTAA
jgi:hypothetical protein